MREIEQIPQLPAPAEKQWQHYLIDSLLAVGGVAVVTVIIYAYHLYPTIPNISLIYLLLILLLASTRGRYAAIVAAVIAALAFDFFLVPPFFTFVIARWEEWIALFVFLVTALITSQLTTQTRQSAEQARLREREARILYEAGRVINMTDSLDEQLPRFRPKCRLFDFRLKRAGSAVAEARAESPGTPRVLGDAPVVSARVLLPAVLSA